MATLTELERRLEALKKARASGVSDVSYDGKTVRYRSLDEIDRAIAGVQREISAATDTTKKPVRTYRVTSEKGL